MLSLVEEVPGGTSPTRAPEPFLPTRRGRTFPGRAARFPALSLLHILGSIAPSFLPQTQHQRRQLAGHAQAQQRRVASLRHTDIVILLKRTRLTDRGERGGFENLFQPGLVVAVQPANFHRLGAADDLPLEQAILAAVEDHQSQSAIAPELAAGAEAVGSLDPGDQASHAQRPQAGDLAQAGTDQMLAALLQQGEPCLAPEAPAVVELIMKQLGAQAACPRRQLLQP